MTYKNLDATDLRGTTVADFLIAIEAEIQICDGDLIVYEEPHFPVVELARSLHIWLREGGSTDFVFNSMSFEDAGAVTIIRADSGWIFGSRLAPESRSSSVSWQEVQECIGAFESQVWSDLVRLNIDPSRIFAN